MENKATDHHLLTTYKTELYTLGYTPSTIFTRIRCLINFKAFTGKEYLKTTPEDLHHFVSYLKKDKQLHSNTIRHYYHSIEQLFTLLQREGILVKNPCNFYRLELIKQAKQSREILTQGEVSELYRVAKKGQETLLLHLAYGCGLRAKEIERINIEDIALPQRLVTIPKGKNSRHRVLPVPEPMVTDMKSYLKQRTTGTTKTKALLLNKKGKRLKAYTARTRLGTILKRTTITKKITLHCLRHSIATHLLENGVKATYVQQFLGHRQLETTELYTRISKGQLKQLP